MLFYVLTILEIITHHADFVFIVLAWIFVIRRLGQAYVHTTSEPGHAARKLVRRQRIAVIVMWIVFAVRILLRSAMTPAARLAAAIEIFGNLESERRPAADALKSWGLAHRFAGSGDRAAIAGLVYDALRRRASSAFLMGAETPRAILIGMLKRERGLDSDAIARLASGEKYAPRR